MQGAVSRLTEKEDKNSTKPPLSAGCGTGQTVSSSFSQLLFLVVKYKEREVDHVAYLEACSAGASGTFTLCDQRHRRLQDSSILQNGNSVPREPLTISPPPGPGAQQPNVSLQASEH